VLSPLPPDAVLIVLRQAFGAAGHVAALVPSYADYCLGALTLDRRSKLTISLPKDAAMPSPKVATRQGGEAIRDCPALFYT
jgi:hypothetical protein